MENFEFREPEWGNIHDYTKGFIKACLHKRVEDRASFEQLMQTNFIKMHELEQLDQRNYKEAINHDIDMNCYGQSSANVMKEIIYRKIHFNEKKLEALSKAQEEFTREAILSVATGGKKEQREKRG